VNDFDLLCSSTLQDFNVYNLYYKLQHAGNGLPDTNEENTKNHSWLFSSEKLFIILLQLEVWAVDKYFYNKCDQTIFIIDYLNGILII
jgi:hypothetical protein